MRDVTNVDVKLYVIQQVKSTTLSPTVPQVRNPTVPRFAARWCPRFRGPTVPRFRGPTVAQVRGPMVPQVRGRSVAANLGFKNAQSKNVCHPERSEGPMHLAGAPCLRDLCADVGFPGRLCWDSKRSRT